MNMEVPVLGFLAEKPMYGYELRQNLETALGYAWQPSFGSLYPMLAKLGALGLIAKSGVSQGFGPQRQVYGITEKGEARLRDMLLNQPIPVGLPLQVLFFDRLTKKERKNILRQARKQREQAVESLKRKREAAGLESQSKYRLMVMDYGIETLQREIAWLARLKTD